MGKTKRDRVHAKKRKARRAKGITTTGYPKKRRVER